MCFDLLGHCDFCIYLSLTKIFFDVGKNGSYVQVELICIYEYLNLLCFDVVGVFNIKFPTSLSLNCSP